MQKLIRENGNVIYLEINSKINSVVTFKGKNNILFLCGGANLCANITFAGDNSLVFVGNALLKGNATLYTNSLLFIGNALTQSSNDTKWLLTSGSYCIIGNDCMFSWGVVFENTDHHPIFDSTNNRILNISDRNMFVGDHIWLGQYVWIRKNAFLASGCIMGAKSIATRFYDSNTANVGSPAKETRKGIFWTKDSTHLLINDNVLQIEENCGDSFKFHYCADEFLSPKSIFQKLDSIKSAYERLEFVYDFIYCNHAKNRFAYASNCKYQIPLPQAKKQFCALMRRDSNTQILANTKQDSAKVRIHNHLAYKLGNAMILNARSFLGWVRMLYVLSFIKESHREEQRKYQEKITKNPNLKLPPLESYEDYQESIKEKQCFTYKLGVALMEANKVRVSRRIFAYLRFFAEVRRLKKEFKSKKK